MENLKTNLTPVRSGVSPKPVDGLDQGAHLRIATARVKFDENVSSGCTIDLVELAAGAVVYPSLSAYKGNTASGAVITIGTPDDTDKFTGAFSGSGGVSLAEVASGGAFKLAAPCVVTAEVASGTVITSGTEMEFLIATGSIA
ncbi:MAG: hypothetical protein PHI35_03305 [Victivallaceae bacterium]|nr:hypothetical protein [Victivallaceae bacterium]